MIPIFPTSREHRNTVKLCTNQTKMHFLSLVHRLQSLAFWNTWELYSNFWPRPASFSKCTSFQHLHQSSKPRRPLSTNLINLALKKFQCNQTWKRISSYVIAQFLKHVNQAMNIEHSQFFLLCLNNVFSIIWAYKNTRIFTCTMNFEQIAFWLMIMQNGGDMYWKFW